MKRVAEILDGKVWRVFDLEDGKEISSGNSRLVFVDITGMSPEPQEGDLFDGGYFAKPSNESLKEQLMATRDTMLAKQAQRFETALCHFMQGALDADDKGYLNWRELMRTLATNPDFDPRNPVWPSLKDEIQKVRAKA